MKSDSQILQDVLRELQWDHRVGAGEVGVEVDNGVVTLTGTVPTYGKKIAAAGAAHHVQGVRDVANDITVVPPDSSTITDTDIAVRLRDTLTWDTLVPDEQITSTVANGWATLEGKVGSISQRRDAERAIEHLEGVRGVTNTIIVERKEVDPDIVRNSIEDALERRAEREATNIGVLVNNSSVTLSGRVHSWQERKAVVDAVSEAPGIQGVIDHLRIDANF